MRRPLARCLPLIAIAFCPRARAIILYGFDTNSTTGNPDSHVIQVNASDPPSDLPTGTLSNSGSQYEGEFQGAFGFTGTAIGPHAFVTAGPNHTEPSNGTIFTYAGGTFTVTGSTAVPGRDMSIVTVSGTATMPILPYWAPIYSTSTDGSVVGKTLVDMGRGTQRGDPIYTNNDPVHGSLRGWTWGPLDNANVSGYLRWGSNVVQQVAVDPSDNNEYIDFTFDRVGTGSSGITDEATISGGDSGGGVFIQSSSGVWKFAGVNHGASPVFYRYDPNTPTTPIDPQQAAAFDFTGLYLEASDLHYYPASAFFPGENPIPQEDEVSNATDLNASVFASYVPHMGDVNCDGKVNALDLNAVATNFGATSGKIWTQGDLNYDGHVNMADFILLAQNFGYSGAVPGEVVAGADFPSAGVPEPSGLALLALAALSLKRRRVRTAI